MAPNSTAVARKISPIVPNNVRKVKELLCDGHYYDVTDWVHRHPGGRVIEFYTESGEDATVAIQQFHNRSITKVAAIMKSFRRRPAKESEIGLNPENVKRHRILTEDFTRLHEELEIEGYFKPSPFHIVYRVLEIVTLACLGLYLFSRDSMMIKTIGVCLFALFQGRCGWLQHESGHHSLTGNSKVDRVITAIVMGLGTGLSSSCWFSQHAKHHAMPNRLQKDVDLDTLPLVAFNAKIVKKSNQGKNFFVRHQALLFLAVDTFLVCLIWKLYQHPRYAWYKKKYFELFCMGLTNAFGYYLGFWPYLAAIWLTAMYMLGNFTLSHTHLPVTSDRLHWVEYSFLHTMNVEPSWWCDWWMGYLNYQIEHHLFPTMPQFRHRTIRDRVKTFAERHGIPYQSASYGQAVSMTYKNLINVSKQLQEKENEEETEENNNN